MKEGMLLTPDFGTTKNLIKMTSNGECSKEESCISSKRETFMFGPSPSDLISKAEVVFEIPRFGIQNSIRLITPSRVPRMGK